MDNIKIRQLVRESIEHLLIEEGVYDPAIFKAIFLAGGPGSGKSYTQSRITSGMGYKVINSDEILEYLAKKYGSSEAVRNADMMATNEAENEEIDEIRDRAKISLNKLYANQIEGRKGIIIDGTGGNYDKIKDQSEELRSLGYDTKMIFVNTSLDTALERNQQRERRVSDEIVNKLWQAVQNNLGKFQNYFGRNNFTIIDNNTPIDEGDKRIRDEIADDVWVEVMNFTRDKPENQIAAKWIENELQIRRR